MIRIELQKWPIIIAPYFNFETLEEASRINSIKVAVTVETDYSIKGASAQVNYSESTSMMSAVKDAAGAGSFSNSQIDNYIWQIGNSGMITKTSTNLAANESLTVYGEYSKSSLRLYAGEIIFVILIIAAIFLFVFLINKRANRKAKIQVEHKKETINNTNSNSAGLGVFSLWNVGVGFVSTPRNAEEFSRSVRGTRDQTSRLDGTPAPTSASPVLVESRVGRIHEPSLGVQ